MDVLKQVAPRFSIIIPSYNSEKTIGRCINSITAQTYTSYEIVAVDDGSSDNSLSILQSYANNSNIDIVVISQQNSGAGAARNKGIDVSKGEYLVFIDSDDYIDGDYLQKANAIIENEKADLIFVDIVREDEEHNILRMEKMSIYKDIGKDVFLRQQLTGKIPWGGVRKIVKRSVVIDNHIQYASIHVGEECIYSFRILEQANKVSFLRDSYYHYVVDTTSLTSNDIPENTVQVFSNIFEYFTSSGKINQFEFTINAMAATSTVIIINVLAKQNGFLTALRESKRYYKKYQPFIEGKIDKDALENRVRICLPFLRAGFITPIIIASYIKSVIGKVKEYG
jgi:glycosyltransferase involved in cell wall biosynthesis